MVVAPRPLRARDGTVEAAAGLAGARRQAEHYAVLLARAFEAGDRVKLTRYASEYPGTEHPLAVRRLAARVRASARCLLDLLDGRLEPRPGHVVVVAADDAGPTVELRPRAAAVPAARPLVQGTRSRRRAG